MGAKNSKKCFALGAKNIFGHVYQKGKRKKVGNLLSKDDEMWSGVKEKMELLSFGVCLLLKGILCKCL